MLVLIIVVCSILTAIFIALIVFMIIGESKDKGNGSHMHYTPLNVKSQDFAGEWSERVTTTYLSSLLNSREHILNNLLLPISEWETTEIDAVIITRKGLFCLEIKNWSGIVEGSDEDEYWVQRYLEKNHPSKQLKNPVMQNENHCYALENVFNHRYKVDNVVIFVNLHNKEFIDSQYVFTISEFEEYYSQLDNELTFEDVDHIYEKLKRYVASEEELEEHKERVRRKYS